MKTTLKTASRTLLATAAAVGVLAMAAPAMAATQTVDALVETGTIYDTGQGTVSVDYWQFDVSTAGTVSIDILSRNVLGGDGGAGGNTSGLDPQILLFGFDNTGDQGLLGSLIGGNDDSSGVGNGSDDGSTSSLDSFLSVALGVGTYVLSLSDWGFAESEARSGVNSTFFLGTYGDYQVTFTGIDTAPAPVPLPAALPLLLGGMSVLGFVGRRRSRAKS
ncbi:hypothetical protein C1J03_08095 [Sulfitobacter sp. SK012]|uniref:DVUA0089 family protein n=1 Tax=Sulfitobacter sp. SK012 TaxID=1389005 RepID=UPI000E103AD2|nr:DVUA0089 family protein [Sulfitobacter sp. SK012]AXI45984.1 hypothetical protein C1J03_08095 [Sulfitobacter sp. SK012]